ncbi:MAG: hypothetical protein J7K81_07250 [Methanophagales archaeon]|nr:hypothetical protein [Methanophagales archaeon]
MKGVIDTCFLVDWVDYRRRDILKLIFDEVILLSEIEKEISDQKARKIIRNWMDERFMKFIRPSQRDINEAIELTTNSYLSTLIGEIHYADALIIAHAKNTGIKNIISENHAVLHLPEHHPLYMDVVVLTAGDIILHAAKMGYINVRSEDDFANILGEYQKETKRKYSTHFVQKLIKELKV